MSDDRCKKCHGTGFIKYYGAKVTLGEERRDFRGRKIYSVNKKADNWIEACQDCIARKVALRQNPVV